MLECIFTIDYEIFGNGEGSLKELVHDPAEKLRRVFKKWNASFVTFVEAAELEIIDAEGTDNAINLVKNQIRDLYRDGFELALHLHPQWYNARYEDRKWHLDYSEYNLCTLSRERIAQIIERSIAYLQHVIRVSNFTPLAFRAGNWLFQPTQTVADVLVENGIKVDSSVFKGGVQRQHKLDYRQALRNGYHWKFSDDVTTPDLNGTLLELPIYTQMVPIWKMFTSKRVGLQRKGSSSSKTRKMRLNRLMDFMQFRYPLKFDFCRMTIGELTAAMDTVIQEDQKNPGSFKPIVLIGHTKDLVDFKTVESFLSYLREKRIKISTFKEVYQRCPQ